MEANDLLGLEVKLRKKGRAQMGRRQILHQSLHLHRNRKIRESLLPSTIKKGGTACLGLSPTEGQHALRRGVQSKGLTEIEHALTSGFLCIKNLPPGTSGLGQPCFCVQICRAEQEDVLLRVAGPRPASGQLQVRE